MNLCVDCCIQLLIMKEWWAESQIVFDQMISISLWTVGESRPSDSPCCNSAHHPLTIHACWEYSDGSMAHFSLYGHLCTLLWGCNVSRTVFRELPALMHLPLGTQETSHPHCQLWTSAQSPHVQVLALSTHGGLLSKCAWLDCVPTKCSDWSMQQHLSLYGRTSPYSLLHRCCNVLQSLVKLMSSENCQCLWSCCWVHRKPHPHCQLWLEVAQSPFVKVSALRCVYIYIFVIGTMFALWGG